MRCNGVQVLKWTPTLVRACGAGSLGWPSLNTWSPLAKHHPGNGQGGPATWPHTEGPRR